MGIYKVNKISLSCFDDKILILNNGIHTLAYFHKDLDRFPQMIINKKRATNEPSIDGLIGVQISSIV